MRSHCSGWLKRRDCGGIRADGRTGGRADGQRTHPNDVAGNSLVVTSRPARVSLDHDALRALHSLESLPRTRPRGLPSHSAKRGSAEFRRFLDISVGPLCELSYAILFVTELG